MYFLTFKIRLAARIDGVRTACLAPLLAAGCPAVTVGWSSPQPQRQQHGSMRAQLCLALYGLWTVARQAPLSVEPYNQEYWSGLPLPTPRDLPNPGIKPASLVSPASGFFTAHATWVECNPCVGVCVCVCVCTRVLSYMWAGLGEKYTQYIKTSR